MISLITVGESGSSTRPEHTVRPQWSVQVALICVSHVAWMHHSIISKEKNHGTTGERSGEAAG